MNYHALMDLGIRIGYELAMCGAETYRIEDTVNHVLESFGVSSEVFAIPNYLIVTIITDDGTPVTRMRRIGFHSTDLDAVETLNALSRAICNRHPSPEEALDWLEQVHKTARHYSGAVVLLGDFLGALGFGILFGCRGIDIIISGLCGVIIGLINNLMTKLKVNPFFSTIAAAFCMALPAYILNTAGIVRNPDTVNIGALMILVPGLLFTNAMRDIIYGDINSGVNRIIQVFLTAAAIALGTASALNLVSRLIGVPFSPAVIDYPLVLQCLGIFISCIGFTIVFNIHGNGRYVCALGGVIAWVVYCLTKQAFASDLLGYFFGAAASSAYAETMARIRKCPAISYLVVSIFPLIPGAGVYYAMLHAVHADTAAFADRGLYTAAIAAVIAVGILLVSTTVKMIHTARTAIHKA